MESRSTLQLHQQRLTHDEKGFFLPPDSEIVVPFLVWSPSGVRLGSCSLVESSRSLAEEYGVVVGHTLVDASSWSASVLMVNPNAEEIVLPSFTCVGNLVPVSAVSEAIAEQALPKDTCIALPDHLEDIVTGSHPSLGRLVDGCCGSSSIGMNMCFQRPRNLLLVELHQFSMKS